MDYIFENLGHERFQELCACIIAKEFPNTQSFPIGQPDGGRDSVVYITNSTSKEFIVFQVKYVKNPNEPDIHKWLTNIIDKEIDKIKELIPRGAKKYYLLTNIRGTAHLDVGSIDKVNKILEQNIKIPSICWWRDDLSRLIEKDPLLKWSFPQILNGQDLLNSTFYQDLTDRKERRENVVRSYLADQYHMDNEVKFKQIDLQNNLLDLFTDVPIKIKKFNEKNKSIRRVIEYFEKRRIISFNDGIEETDGTRAATFLLHSNVQGEIQRILLEGGPGQGKSTISQYICQVHRARLLGKQNDLERVPDEHKNIPVRLPFKVDLRHIAAWVVQKNPYENQLNESFFSSIWKNSLESFLIAHIIYHSKIDDLNVSDLISIIKSTSTLFVFDGFDEIADLTIRESVIDFINKGINRLLENSKSIQVIITSRPAAFSDAIGFSSDIYPHFELTDITFTTISEYVEKWVRASRLDTREASEIKRLVEEKLKMPHLRDLAKSPMQLAILISLLRTRGESLPNKRTALYDSYIDLFFNRESEKNHTIRDYRDLIIDIHQYLAWILHSEAEMYKNTGSINIEDLKDRLRKYLLREGHKTDITDELFDVVKERVCALVSRVQGTFEFEVQPLREYFCAKYLYNTSPYSPIGNEKKGTKPERFNAIARDFYWHNVVRFFAGCFDRGELPMLVQQLKELQDDDILKYTNYPRLLTSQILSDWVFTQYPLLMKDVVKIIVDGISLGNIIGQGDFGRNPILLPLKCGREEIVIECFNQLSKFPHTDYALELIDIIKNNPSNNLEYWMDLSKVIPKGELTKWYQYAYWLGIIHRLKDEEILQCINLCSTKQEKVKVLQIIISGNKVDMLNENVPLKQLALEELLGSNLIIDRESPTKHSLFALSFVLQPYVYANVIYSDYHSPHSKLLDLIYRHSHIGFSNTSNLDDQFTFPINDQIDESIKSFIISVTPILQNTIIEWKTNSELWDNFIESFRQSFHDKWIIYIYSAIAAGIKEKEQISDDFSNLEDNSRSLFKRVRYARLRSGNTKYWKKQIENSNNTLFVVFIFLTWGTIRTIKNLSEELSDIINKLNKEEYSNLYIFLNYTTCYSANNLLSEKDFNSLNESDLNARLKSLLSFRIPYKRRENFLYNNKFDENDAINFFSEGKLNFLIEKYLRDTSDKKILNEIKTHYLSSDFQYTRDIIFRNRYLVHQNESVRIPFDIAKEIMCQSKNYPRIISYIAEKSCRSHANQEIMAVGEIAKRNDWFG